MSDDFENWIIQVRKGLLELCILNRLVGQDKYGYELVKKLLEVPGLGVKEGTIYPLLTRLKSQGLVDTFLIESKEGPARKYYRLTEKGENMRIEMNKTLQILTRNCINEEAPK